MTYEYEPRVGDKVIAHEGTRHEFTGVVTRATWLLREHEIKSYCLVKRDDGRTGGGDNGEWVTEIGSLRLLKRANEFDEADDIFRDILKKWKARVIK